MTTTSWHEFKGSGLFCDMRGCGQAHSAAVHQKPAPAPTTETARPHRYVANPACCTFPVDDAVHIETRYDHAPGAHTIDEAYEEFHRNNPRVFDELVKLAREAQAAGAKHYGIAALFEVLRWHRLKSGEVIPDDDGFKLNNNLRAVYARKIMEAHPELAGFFRTRARAGEEPADG
ncbi:MAG TPA: hypothetical protein VF761_17045 [Gemmatimonadaceae bacterium]